MAGPQRGLPQATVGSGTISDSEAGPLQTRYRREAAEFNERLKGMTPEEREKSLFMGMPSSKWRRYYRQGRIDPSLLSSRPEDAGRVSQQEFEKEKARLDLIRSPRDPRLEQIGDTMEREAEWFDPTITSFEPAEAQSIGVGIVQAFAEETGQSIEQAEKALGVAGINIEERQRDIKKKDLQNIDDPAQSVDFWTNKALENVFGKGSAYDAHGVAAAETMELLGQSKNYLSDLMTDAQEAGLTVRNYSKLAAAEQIRQQEAKHEYNNQVAGYYKDEVDNKKKAHDKIFGKDGIGTQWLEQSKKQIANVQNTAHMSEGFFEDWSWGDTWKTVGAVLAMGANVAGKIALSKRGWDDALPHFAVPLIMKSIDADIRRDESKARDARQKATDFVSLADGFLNLHRDEQLSLETIRKTGIEAARAKMNHEISKLPKGKQLEQYRAVLDAQLKQKAIEQDRKIQKGLLGMVLDVQSGYQKYANEQRAADSHKTQRGYSQLNAMATLQAMAKKPEIKPQFNNDDRKQMDAEADFLSKIRTIESYASKVLAQAGGDFGTIQQAVNMTLSGFTNKFIETPGLGDAIISDATLLNQELNSLVVNFASTFEERLTDEDIKRYTKMLGTLENTALKNVLTRIRMVSYAIKEKFLTRMARAKKTGDWALYEDQFRVALLEEPNVALDRFQKSVLRKIELQKQGDAGAHLRRLDVGMRPFKIIWDEASRLSELDREQIEDFFNAPIQGNFVSDFDDMLENEIRMEQDRKQREETSSVVPEREGAALPGRRTTPGAAPKEEKEKFTYINPLKKMKLTSAYNPPGKTRKHPVTGARVRHGGIDLAADVGTPLYSPFKGKVLFAGVDKKRPANGYKVELLDPRTNLIWTFAHLEKSSVKIGDMIEPGAAFAATGQSGRVSGPHLHLQVKTLKGKLLDPAVYLTDAVAVA